MIIADVIKVRVLIDFWKDYFWLFDWDMVRGNSVSDEAEWTELFLVDVDLRIGGQFGEEFGSVEASRSSSNDSER